MTDRQDRGGGCWDGELKRRVAWQNQTGRETKRLRWDHATPPSHLYSSFTRLSVRLAHLSPSASLVVCLFLSSPPSPPSSSFAACGVLALSSTPLFCYLSLCPRPGTSLPCWWPAPGAFFYSSTLYFTVPLIVSCPFLFFMICPSLYWHILLKLVSIEMF